MADNKWSQEQPPEWTGPAIGETPPVPAWQPPTAPPVTAAPAAAIESTRRPDLGLVLKDVWRLLRLRGGFYIGGSIVLVAISIALATALATALLPDGLSDQSKAILSGNASIGTATTELTEAQLAAILTDLGQASLVLMLTLVFGVVLQFVFGSLITKLTLADAAGEKLAVGQALRGLPFVKLISSSLAIGAVLLAGLVALVIAAILPDLLGSFGVVLMLAALSALAFAGVWFGLGISFVSAVVIAENVGSFASIRRSLALAKRNRLPLFGALLVVGLLSSMPLNVVTNAISTLADFSFATYFTSALLPIVLSLPATAVLSAVLYRQLRP